MNETDLDLVALAELLRRRGHVRGNPVAISMFRDEIPPQYLARQVEPCALVRCAMDFGEYAYVDAANHACVAGAWQAGFIDPPEEIKTGRYLATNTPYFTEEAARLVKTGENALPQGMFRAIGSAPLDAVPDGVAIDLLVVVCEPQYAATIAAARTAIDGVPPRGAAGTSLCGELFAVPYHDPNVILTPGDMGGRMFNHIRPSEMFVIVPMQWASNLTVLLEQRPDLGGLMEAIKPGYLEARDAKRRRIPVASEAPTRAESTPAPVGAGDGGGQGSIPWDDDAAALLAAAPEFVREFAVPNLEAYAAEHGHPRITMAVLEEQMASVGMRLEDVTALIEEEQTPASAAPFEPAAPASPNAAPLVAVEGVTAASLDPRAPVQADGAVLIEATALVVWDALVAVTDWPHWYKDIRSVVAGGPMGGGSTFSFKTGPVSIDATVTEFRPGELFRFRGKTRGAVSTYVFRIDPVAGGVQVSAAQVMTGATARAMKPMLQKVAAASLPAWLQALKDHVERP